MQATHYNSCETNQTLARHPKDPASFTGHSQFAEEVLGEKPRIVAEEYDDTSALMRGLHHHLKDRHWIFLVWAVEALCITFLLVASCMEIWTACPLDSNMGLALECWHCYGKEFINWSLVFAIMWGTHLYLTMLLASRGYNLGLVERREGLIPAPGPGIPRGAVTAFVLLFFALMVWVIVGVAMLVLSSICTRGDQTYANHPRSGLLLTSISCAVVAGPFLIVFGRYAI